MTEDTVDSWEDLEDNGELDKQLKNLVPTHTDSEDLPKPSHANAPVFKLQEDNSGRTAYKPSVRILKREPNATGHNNPAMSTRSTQSKPIRTLEEREAAYAEARLRILGCAESPQESNTNNGEATAVDLSGSAPGGSLADGSSTSLQNRNAATKDSLSSGR